MTRATGRAAVLRAGARTLAGIAAVAIGVTLAPPNAEALDLASANAVRESVIADARNSAAKPRKTQDDPETPGVATASPSQTPASESKPLAEATLSPGKEVSLESDGRQSVSAEFSGHKVAAELDLAMTPLAKTEAASAAAVTDGIVLGQPVEITAQKADGSEVTKFPADVVTVKDAYGVESAKEVTPGITLGFELREEELTKAKVDPAGVKIYTRETAADPWVELPSYFDATSRTVVGESDHLSQFIVIGQKYVAPKGPTIVLDPDDDYGWAQTPSPAWELPLNVKLANQAAVKLSQLCLSDVVVTRQADVRFVSGETRAAIARAAEPTITLTVAFDALTGASWGTKADGGTYLYSKTAAGGQLAGQLLKAMPDFTGRPSGTRPANGIFPDPAFDSVPGAVAHMETLYLDHNLDRPVIDNGFGSIVNGAVTGIAKYAESKGFNCSDPARGGLPKKPSKAELAKWAKLGHQNYLTYGADPVSFSTGNLVEDESLFALSGPGAQAIELGFTYNSQDGRLSRVGAGWSFNLGGRLQRFDDGSVLLVRGDGASFGFNPKSGGGYTATESGTGLTLREAGAGVLELKSDLGESWRFDAADEEGIGELISYADRHGGTLKLAYGTADPDVHQFVPLVSVTDGAGQTVRFENDRVGRITAIVHPDGRKWRLGYSSAGDLASITAPDGGVRKYSYDAKHQLLTATDALGITYLKNQYDSSGRVVKQWDGDGNLRTFAYASNANGGSTKYVNAEGHTTTFTWDQAQRITGVTDANGATTKFAYDASNRTTRTTDPDGSETKYTYDTYGNVTKEIGPDDRISTFTWTPSGELLSETDPAGRTTKHEYNTAGLQTRTVRPDGSVIDFAYNAAGDLVTVKAPSGATTNYRYDARGNLLTETSAAGRTTKYTYDLANRPVTMTDGEGGVTRFQYDPLDNLAVLTDPLGRVTRFSYDRQGQVTAVTAPDGGVTSYSYDRAARIWKVTDPAGGATTYSYTKEDAVTAVTDPLGSVVNYQVDPVGQVRATTDALGGKWTTTLDVLGRPTVQGDPLGRKTSTSYDPAGQVASETDPSGGTWNYTYDAVGNLTKETDPLGGETKYVYDELDRLTRVTDPDGRTESSEYDADDHLIATTDSIGAVTAMKVDADGLPLSVTNALGESTTVKYDGNGQTTEVIDPLGAVTTYEYDAAGQLVKSIDALGGVTSTVYDAMGRETAVTDAAGNTRKTAYDLLGRVTSATDATGGVTKYTYDAAGRQTSAVDADGRTIRYEYDPAGQLVKAVQGDAELSASTSYTYTSAGELASIVNPVGESTRFTYDSAGRQNSRTDAGGVSKKYRYDALGRVSHETNGAGQALEYSYSKAGLLLEVSAPDGKQRFEYDGAGRMVLMQDPTGVTGWKRDKLGRTVSETSQTGKTTAVSFDKAGRVAGVKLPTGKQIAYEYDPLGRMTKQQTPWGDQSYSWRADGVLTGIVRGDGVMTTYASDAEGRPTEIVHSLPDATTSKPSVLAEKTIPGASSLKKRADALAKRGATEAAPKSCPEDGAAGYLTGRDPELVALGHVECVKTGDYLNRRTLPTQPNPVEAGGSLRYGYTYTPAGDLASDTREIRNASDSEQSTPPGEPAAVRERVNRVYGYDSLDRLISSTTTRTSQTDSTSAARKSKSTSPTEEVVKSRYGYDLSGNRTLSETTTNTGEVKATQEYTAGGRLSKLGIIGSGDQKQANGNTSYSYDGAGRRTTERSTGRPSSPSSAGETSYEYSAFGNSPTRVKTPDVTTETKYDALGRAASQNLTTKYGTDKAAFSSLEDVQLTKDSSEHGTTTSIWDALGGAAGISTDTDDQARWALLDRLGSVVAEATGNGAGSISQLASYSDYGTPDYESAGFAQLRGYTGETQDGSTGTVSFGSRQYDSGAGAWMAPDAWPGLVEAPQTLNGYSYVLGNPTTFADEGGFRPYEPGYNVRYNGQRGGYEYRKVAPSATRPAPAPVYFQRAAPPFVPQPGNAWTMQRRYSSWNMQGNGFQAENGKVKTPRIKSRMSGQFRHFGARRQKMDTLVDIITKGWDAFVNSQAGRISAQILDSIIFIAPAGRAASKGLGISVERSAIGRAGAKVTAGGIQDALRTLPKGKQSHVRVVDDEITLKMYFNAFTEGAKKISRPGLDGVAYRLSDGTEVSLRNASRSGGRTIDIKIPGKKEQKIHIKGK